MATSGVFRTFYYFLDDVQLTEINNEFSKDTLICQGEDFIVDLGDLFDTNLLEDASFEWDDGSSESFRILTDANDYFITAQTNCGEVPISINFQTEDCAENFYIPNAFDPSSTGENKSFTIINTEVSEITDYRLSIYDRWGTLLFESRDAMIGWDGTSQNNEVSAGVYSWQLSYLTTELNGSVKKYKQGEVLLIR